MRRSATLSFDHERDLSKCEPLRIGVLVLESDQGIEDELRAMVPANVVFHVTRVPSYGTPRASSADHLEHVVAAARCLAACDGLDAVLYGCTSGALVVGEAPIRAAIAGACTDAEIVLPIESTLAAFDALDIDTVSLMTPYDEALNELLVAALEAAGLAIDVLYRFPLESGRDIASVRGEFFERAARYAADAPTRCLFVACNALPVAASIGPMEAILRCPVVTSTQALLGAVVARAARHAPFRVRPGFGRLLDAGHRA